MVKVTEHAILRSKERCGLNRKAAERMAEVAWEKGLTHAECTGKLKKYVSALYFKNKVANRVRIYGEIVYVFGDSKLITILPLPNEYKKLASILEKKKEKNNEETIL